MATIFKNKRVEEDDTINEMRFPPDANIVHLPFDCSTDGQLGELQVKDEKGVQWTLTCKKKGRKIYFAKGWKEFSQGKRIGVGHKISLYKEDGCFGSGGAGYKITVEGN